MLSQGFEWVERLTLEPGRTRVLVDDLICPEIKSAQNAARMRIIYRIVRFHSRRRRRAS